MDYLLPLAVLALAHLVAVMSPGPSFILVTRASVGMSRRHGVVASLAMGVGAAVWAAAALFGLAAVLTRLDTLYDVLRAAGGAYLIVLAVMMWRGAGHVAPKADASVVANAGLWPIFRSALLLQLSNPKVVVFFGSIFVGLLPPSYPAWVGLAVVGVVLVNETLWYVLVATLFSTARLRAGYDRARIVIERFFAVALGALGAKLILDRT